jgi:hypothetical protein
MFLDKLRKTKDPQPIAPAKTVPIIKVENTFTPNNAKAINI